MRKPGDSPFHRPSQLDGVERVIVTSDATPAASVQAVVTEGYAVELSGRGIPSRWMFFPALEPAFMFGRVGRMGHWVSDWEVHRATFVMDWDGRLERDVSTLYVDPSMSFRDHSREGELMQGFLDHVDPRSSSWTFDQ